MDGFTHELIEAGAANHGFSPRPAPARGGVWRAKAYARVARAAEPLELEYQPSVQHDFAVELARNRARERAFRSTIIGPHRDELQLRLDGKSAAKFASEGQKRSIAIALKLAQAEYLTDLHGVPPILLIDDVMGELDAKRRAGFPAPAGPRATRPQPGLHDLHRGKLAAGTGPRPAPLGSHRRAVEKRLTHFRAMICF